MEKYQFIFNDKNYELTLENLEAFINDEESPVQGINASNILELLNENSEVSFDAEYYEESCENCKTGVAEKAKYFEFLEFHFYIFTKDGNYVMSTLSKAYEDTSYNRLLKQGKVDKSYIASVIVCKHCSDYSIEIEQCEI